MGHVLVTAADEGYADLVGGLVLSLWDQGVLTPWAHIVIIDCGLSPSSRRHLVGLGAYVVDPMPLTELLMLAEASGDRSQWGFLGRPFLPVLLEALGFLEDVIVWLDADTWVQNPKGIANLVWTATRGQLAAVAEVDRAFAFNSHHRLVTEQFKLSRYTQFFGDNACNAMVDQPMINSGVMAARHDHPIWEAWQSSIQLALLNGRVATFGIDQASLCHAVYSGIESLCPLPVTHNWTVAMAIPVLRAGRLVSPLIPHEEIHVVHMIDSTKRDEINLRVVDTHGDTIETIRTRIDYATLRNKRLLIEAPIGEPA